MAWVTPIIHSVGDILSASDWNISSNDLNYLYGDSAWTTPAITSPWSAAAYPNSPRYIGIGRYVTLNGIVTGGTLSDPCFTLPSSYWPSQTVRFGTEAGSSAYAYMEIQINGQVVPFAGSTTNFVIDGTFCRV